VAFGILELKAAARSFVLGARVGHLATAAPDGAPHVVPVCFALAGGRVYIALDEKPKSVPPRELRRVRNLLENPRVQLVVDRYDEDWRRLGFVQLSGTASLIEGGEEHAAAVAALRDKYPQYRSMSLESRPVIRIEVARATAWGDLSS
jgi:PPOX class probable F420-dependent enzyme